MNEISLDVCCLQLSWEKLNKFRPKANGVNLQRVKEMPIVILF